MSVAAVMVVIKVKLGTGGRYRGVNRGNTPFVS
jgi:hypothetical protein